MGLPQPRPHTLTCDSLSAIDISENAVLHGRTKAVEIHFHWLREKIRDGTLKMKHCSLEDMIADIFTKALHPGPFNKFRIGLGLNAINGDGSSKSVD